MLTHRMILEATWLRYGEGRGCHRRRCVLCGSIFYATRPEARYCGAACRQQAYRRRLQMRKKMPSRP